MLINYKKDSTHEVSEVPANKQVAELTKTQAIIVTPKLNKLHTANLNEAVLNAME